MFWLSDILYFMQGILMAITIISFVLLLFYLFYKMIQGGLDEVREEWEDW
jgi:F0F1-type ATP synthase membrane subunit b/b'